MTTAPPPRPRTRTAAAIPQPADEPPAPTSRVQRSRPGAAPPVPRPRPRAGVTPTHVTGLATAHVEVEHKDRGKTTSVEYDAQRVARRLPDGTFTPATVTVSGGATIQPRQYESVRVEVGLSLPCYPDAEGYEGAYQEASEWVQAKILDETRKALEG